VLIFKQAVHIRHPPTHDAPRKAKQSRPFFHSRRMHASIHSFIDLQPATHPQADGEDDHPQQRLQFTHEQFTHEQFKTTQTQNHAQTKEISTQACTNIQETYRQQKSDERKEDKRERKKGHPSLTAGVFTEGKEGEEEANLPPLPFPYPVRLICSPSPFRPFSEPAQTQTNDRMTFIRLSINLVEGTLSVCVSEDFRFPPFGYSVYFIVSRSDFFFSPSKFLFFRSPVGVISFFLWTSRPDLPSRRPTHRRPGWFTQASISLPPRLVLPPSHGCREKKRTARGRVERKSLHRSPFLCIHPPTNQPPIQGKYLHRRAQHLSFLSGSHPRSSSVCLPNKQQRASLASL